MKNSLWFYSLNKPFLNPPDWLFAPVWTILYILMIISFALFLKGGITKEKKIPLFLFIVQLCLNFSWYPIFFGAKCISCGLAVITFMWFFVLFTVIAFYRHSKPAAVLLIPYLIWVSFAFYLNFAYFVLN